jgi:acetyl-CoA carboxylase carboxyltransferase component
MGGMQAATVLLTVRRDNLSAQGRVMSQEEQEAFKAPILETYEREGNPYYATARLWDDGILVPTDTRKALALGLAAASNAPNEPTNFGVFRM